MFNQNKKAIISGSIIIAVLLVIIIILSIINRSPVSVMLTSPQSPIDVYIDNEHFVTPTTIKLKPNTYTIWGAKIGYLTYKKDFTVSRKNSSLNIIMEVDPNAGYPPEGAPK